MDLADFPRLKKLELQGTAVTGDIRHIQDDDLPSMATFLLPSTVVGGVGHEFQRISEVPSFMHAIHPLLHRTPKQHGRWDYFMEIAFDSWKLSSDSPDWYWFDEESNNPSPPFCWRFIQAGPRLGWCWRSNSFYHHCCRVNWLDSEPSSDSGDYETYRKGLERIERGYFSDFRSYSYRGYHQPPTEEEYRRLFEE